MIAENTLDLHQQIDSLEQSHEAMNRFLNRVALFLDQELTVRGVEFHAVNDRERAVGGDGFNYCGGVSLSSTGGEVKVFSSDGMAYDRGQPCGMTEEPLPAVTSLCDSEVRRVVIPIAENISKQSKRIVFGKLYTPKAVFDAQQCNNHRVCFRFVHAWDAVRSGIVMRFDYLFKNLNA